MGFVKVFLDSNILFSAALAGPVFDLIWELRAKRHISLCTTSYCVTEAEHNLRVKNAGALVALWLRFNSV